MLIFFKRVEWDEKMIEKEYRRLNIPAGDLRVSITNGCNMACEYCHNEGQLSKDIKFMSLDKFKYIIDNSVGYGVFKVRITGGEPLLHKQLGEILQFLRINYPDIEVGLNTNGLLREKLVGICSSGLVDRVVIGMDFYDADISKKSLIGISSKAIRDTVLQLIGYDIKVEIAVVYDENKEDVLNLVEWGLTNGIVIKVIEKTCGKKNKAGNRDYFDVLSEIKEKYGLKCGITADLKEYYLTNGHTRIKFFQSHCDRKECDVCSRLHMRVTCDGAAEPCIMRKDTVFSLVDGNFRTNMCRAIANLGNGPQRPIV